MTADPIRTLIVRELLQIPGVVSVSFADHRVMVFVEREADRFKVPVTIYGRPVEVKVIGKVTIL